MNELRRASLIAVFLIVVLRMSIGWQLLYEGLWKYDTLDGPTPWSSEGYLKNAQGPLRNYFREMAGDADELGWMDYAEMSRRWYDWRDRFAAHYQLDPQQLDRLNILIDGSAKDDSPSDQTPPARIVSLTVSSWPTVRNPRSDAMEPINPTVVTPAVAYDAGKKTLSAKEPITPKEEADLLALVDISETVPGQLVRRTDPTAAPDPAAVEYFNAVRKLAGQSRELSYRHKLAGVLKGNPDFAGVTAKLNERGSFDPVMGTLTADQAAEDKSVITYGKIQEYKDLLADYERSLKQARIDYQSEHAVMLGRKAAIMRNELSAPAKSLNAALMEDAAKLLTVDQLRRGALPPVQTPLYRADMQVMWGLLLIGTCLIIGFLTRVSAVLGAVMLMMFYLVIPPWPGVPPAPGPEHSFIINKNMIESLALLAIAALPTGTWFGIDGLFYALWNRRRGTDGTASNPTAPPAARP